MNAEKLQAQSWPAPMFSDSAALESSDPVTSDLENSAPWKPETEENFPEGGLQAWLVVFGAWCGLFAALGITNTIAAFQSYLSHHQLKDYDESSIGWIFSTYTFLSFFCGIYIGPIFDKHGPRWLILAGTVCIGVSLQLLSICKEYWHYFLVFGVLNGVGCSLLFTPCLAAVGHFFRQRRGLTTGIASSGGSIGGIVFPIMLQNSIKVSFLDWDWSVRILGFVCLFLMGISNFFVRSRLPPARDASIHPDIRIFKERIFLIITIGVFLMEFALFIPLTYISSYAISKGFSQDFSFQILAILNAGSFFGRTLPGWWADYAGPFNSNMMAVLLSMIACLAVWLPFGHHKAGLIVFAALIGFSSGNNISITPVCIGRLCPTQSYGRYYATCFTVVSVACLIGIPIGGAIIKACDGEYWGLILFTGVLYALSLVAMIVAKVMSTGWNPLAKF